MNPRIVSIESTELFVGTPQEPHQVLRVEVEGGSAPLSVTASGATARSATVQADTVQGTTVVELPMSVDGDVRVGDRIPLRVEATDGTAAAQQDTDLVIAELGWTMHMVSHFHYDPVWWNTQAAYTSEWDQLDFAGSTRAVYQHSGFNLVKAHLATARRDADYCFVLAEVDYLKPYWDMHPEDRAYLKRLLAEGRVELMGGTYNEPNTNLTSAESTARNAVYGTGFQRDVMGGDPATAWQLDAFGHDPQFPGMMADAGLTSSSWARGPFHQWGPMLTFWNAVPSPAEGMQFRSEFEWLSPSGRGVLTSYMANHYSAGWWMDSAPTLEDAENATYRIFRYLKEVAATRHVLLPVGTDYTPPNRWVTQIHRHWNQRYVWPRFLCSLPKTFFAAVRTELAERGRRPSPQTRDMNPIYTGKDVSFIDTKQAQRRAEGLLLDAEKWATFAAILGFAYPEEGLDKAWRQLVYGAHHDAITGAESDQVYLDLLAGWREALELARAAHDAATRYLAGRIRAAGQGWAVTVFNSLAWRRDDVVRVVAAIDRPRIFGLRLRGPDGADVPFLCESVRRGPDGALTGVTLSFRATGVPSLGYRTWRLLPAAGIPDGASWQPRTGGRIANQFYEVGVDATRGGGIDHLYSRALGRQLVRRGAVANELAVYDEYPEHPAYHEGPWHLLPRGHAAGSADAPAHAVVVESCDLGERIVVTGAVGPARYTQEVTLWAGVDRVDLRTYIDDWRGSDQLVRVRFPCPVEGALPVSEVGNAVIGRGFAFPDVDTARHPWTLDNPAYTFFAAGSTARVRVTDGSSGGGAPAERALGIAEIVVPDEDSAAPLCRDLAIALVRAGVTATTSSADRPRYGLLRTDSNLPDFRIAVGGAAANAFTARVLAATDPAYADEVERQLRARKCARVWVPGRTPLTDVWVPDADLTPPDALPVLVVATDDADTLDGALAAIVADLADAVIEVDQPAALHPRDPFDANTVAVLNRGIPGFGIDPRGTLHLSLLRSCTGWPSGVWIDPPRRTVPDGSAFQLQHWSHCFEYAFTAGPGDWRQAGLVPQGHGFNHPLTAVVHDGTGDLPAHRSLLQVRPEGSVVVTSLKPTGNPLATGRVRRGSAGERITARLYESRGTRVTVGLDPFVPFLDAMYTDLLENDRGRATVVDGALQVDLDGAEIATISARPQLPAPRRSHSAEPARGLPSFSRYWLHNRGVAPTGGHHLAVHLHGPGRIDRPTPVRCTVASDLSEDTAEGQVVITAPPGWRAEPSVISYRLDPGAHHAADVLLTPTSALAAPERAGVLSARATGPDGHSSEDTMIVAAGTAPPDVLTVDVLADRVDLRAGDQTTVPVSVSSGVDGILHVELQAISPIETWDMVAPWSQELEVVSACSLEAAVRITVPPDAQPGQWWLLMKAMAAGHTVYTKAIPLCVVPANAEPSAT
jgi:alpha-mannosidase